jgi:hypothetical protein
LGNNTGFGIQRIRRVFSYSPTPSTTGAKMISNDCSIYEFVEQVKDNDVWKVVTLAVEEADKVDRLMYHKDLYSKKRLQNARQYSNNLKQLISYIRYESKPYRPKNVAYQLYTNNWGEFTNDKHPY